MHDNDSPWSLRATLRRAFDAAEADVDSTPTRLLRAKQHASALVGIIASVEAEVGFRASGADFVEGARVLAESMSAAAQHPETPAQLRPHMTNRGELWALIRGGAMRLCPTCGRPGSENPGADCVAEHAAPSAAGVVRLFAAISAATADLLGGAVSSRDRGQIAFALDLSSWAAKEAAMLADVLLDPVPAEPATGDLSAMAAS